METTQEYILEKVAPLFNKKGYNGTSLSEITKATNLTKGAVYFYFRNKEDLAFQAFHLNVKKLVKPLNNVVIERKGSINKLYGMTFYFKEYYYELASERGGCPLLNLGVDARFNNPILFEEARKICDRLIQNTATIITHGIKHKEIKEATDAHTLATNIYSMIEGGIFMSLITQNKNYIVNIANHIESAIIEQIRL